MNVPSFIPPPRHRKGPLAFPSRLSFGRSAAFGEIMRCGPRRQRQRPKRHHHHSLPPGDLF